MLELRDHQAKVLPQIKNGCILWGGVGSGKSPTSVAYYMEKVAPLDIVVITTAKKRDSLDWEKEFARVGVGKYPGATTAGVLTVDSWNNIAKYTELQDAFVVFDEQRLVGSGAWTKAFYKIAKRNHWILLSATPGDTWLDYIPVFVANGFYKNRTAFLREHVVYNTFTKFPKVDRYIGTGTLLRHRQSLLVHMPYPRHTKRHLVDVQVDFDQERFNKVWKDRWHVFEDRPIRDIAETFLVARKVVNSSSSRLDSVRSKLDQHPRLIVFYNFDYELMALRELGQEMEAKWNGTSSSSSGSRLDARDAEGHGLSFPYTKNDTSSVLLAATARKDNQWQTLSPVSTESSVAASMEMETPSSSALAAARSSGKRVSKLLKDDSSSTIQSTKSGSTFQLAEWNGHKHQEVPKTERWLYLVQFVAGAEGWNCIETDATMFYSLPYSYKIWEQAHGRIDRLNTPFTDLYYYALKSNSLIDQAVWSTLQKKKSFNERAYLKKVTQPEASRVSIRESQQADEGSVEAYSSNRRADAGTAPAGSHRRAYAISGRGVGKNGSVRSGTGASEGRADKTSAMPSRGV